MDAPEQTPLVLITAGGRGVGAATTRLAAAQGYDVAVSFVSNEDAALTVTADVEAAGRWLCAQQAVRAPVSVARRPAVAIE